MAELHESQNSTQTEMVRNQMGYSDGADCCKVCCFFGPSEARLLGGSPEDRPARCERNAFWFRVEEAGRCLHHQARKGEPTR